MHIVKSLKTHCTAIRRAVEVYNLTALALVPPHPLLDWSVVLHYSFLDEFNLLHETHEDIRSQRWTEPAVCTTMKQDLQVTRAYEEIECCNIEVHCLHTSIYNEHALFTDILCKLEQKKDPLSGPVMDYVVHRHHANAHLKARILQIHDLPGFTGDQSIGIRNGKAHSTQVDVPAERVDDGDDEAAEDIEPDDQMSGDLASLIEYMTELPI